MKQNIKIVYSWKGLIFLISTLLVLSLYGLPHALYHFEAPNPSWMAFSGAPDEEYYLTMVEEVYRGRSNLVNPFLAGYEAYKGSPIFPLFPFYLTGRFQRILHLSPKTLAIFFNLMAPLAVFYLLFSLGRKIGLGFKTSILASFMSVSTPFLFLFEPAISARIFMLPAKHLLEYFLPLSRIINPQIGILFFIGTLALWVDFRRAPYPMIGCLACSALCMASNPFMGTALIAFWGSELVIESVMRDKLRNIAASFLALVITCIPLVIQWRESESLRKIFPDMYLVDLQSTRLPLITTGEVIAVALLSLHLLLRRGSFYENIRDRFVVLSVVSYLICMNQQIVTGKMVNSWHYELYVFNLILSFIVAVVVTEWRETKSFLAISRALGNKKVSALFFLVGILISGVGLVGSGRIYPIAPAGIKELASMFKAICIIVGGLSILSGCALLIEREGSAVGYPQKKAAKKKHIRKPPKAISLRKVTGASLLLFIVLMAFSFGDGMVEQLYGYESQKKWQISFESEFKEPFQWINANLGPSNVFLGYPLRFSATSFIPIYTNQKVFISSNSIVHPTPGLRDSQKRLFIILALVGMSEYQFMEQIKNKDFLNRLFFHKKTVSDRSWQTMIFDPFRLPPTSDQEISDAAGRYKPYTSYTIEELFRLGQIDYLYWSRDERRNFKAINPNKLEFLEKVFSTDRVEIYRVKH